MKILVAPNSFKQSLSSKEAADKIAYGIRQVLPDVEILSVPLADGGEGTVQSLVDATSGKIIKTTVHDPLMRKVGSYFGMLGDGKTMVIEMAAASGIELLQTIELNPLKTTTYGTGELIKSAMDLGCNTMIIGIGGSATNDGGAGMAIALGVKFLDIGRNEIGQGGESLSTLAKIDLSGLDQRLKSCKVIVAADVNNPLTGNNGASRIYAPQKGASPDDVELLEKNLKHYAAIIREQLKIDIENMPGSGAAGGLGAGLMAFTNAKIENGFNVVSQIIGLEEKIIKSDLIITGEGKIDEQTQFGKTPQGVATLAKKYQKPVIAFAGTLGEGFESLYHQGFDQILPISHKRISQEESIRNAGQLLENAARQMAGGLKKNGLKFIRHGLFED
ncbi:MAG: glycerate kinase [Bacteroidales bacterium]|nr:glycerate kinase [Bacteroidales bacterium]